MTTFRDGGRERLAGAMARHRTLTVALLALTVAAGTTDVPTLAAAPTKSTADTTRTPPLHFRKTVLFDTKYLARAAEARRAEARLERERAETAETLSDEGRAATYAKRYGISRDLAQKILDVATAEGIDPELGFRLVRVESVFKPDAKGPAGALGLTQLMFGTARSVDRSVKTRADVLDPKTNLRIGFRYLRQMIERYDGDVRLGLLAYNRGEGTVDRALKRGRDPENGYSKKVLGVRAGNGSPYKGKGLLQKPSAKDQSSKARR